MIKHYAKEAITCYHKSTLLLSVKMNEKQGKTLVGPLIMHCTYNRNLVMAEAADNWHDFFTA